MANESNANRKRVFFIFLILSLVAIVFSYHSITGHASQNYNPDKNGNGYIDLKEMMTSISLWKINNIDSILLNEILNFWKLGTVYNSSYQANTSSCYYANSISLPSVDLKTTTAVSKMISVSDFEGMGAYASYNPTSGSSLFVSNEKAAKGSNSLKVVFTQFPGGFHVGLNVLPNEVFRIRAKVFVPSGPSWNGLPKLTIFNESWSSVATVPTNTTRNQWIDYELYYNSSDARYIIINVGGTGAQSNYSAYYFYVDEVYIEKTRELNPSPLTPIQKYGVAKIYTSVNEFTNPSILSKIIAMSSQLDLWRFAGDIWSKDEYGSFVKHINPNLLLTKYHNCESVWRSTPEYNYISQVHPEWFLRNSSGGKVEEKDFPGNYINDMCNHTFVDWITDRIVQRVDSQAFDVYFMDVPNAYYYDGYYSSSLINPKTGKVFTSDEWRACSIDYISTFRSKTAKKIIINPIGAYNGWQYFAGSKNHTKDFFPFIDGMMIEGFMGTLSLSSEANWKMDIEQLIELEQNGKMVMVISSIPGGLSIDELNKRHTFYYSSFLLGKGQNSYFNFQESRFFDPLGNLSSPTIPPEYTLKLGSPKGKYAKVNNVYQREFDNGIVLVNPTSGSYSVNLGSQYRYINGTAVSSLQLSNFEGAILLKECS